MTVTTAELWRRVIWLFGWRESLRSRISTACSATSAIVRVALACSLLPDRRIYQSINHPGRAGRKRTFSVVARVQNTTPISPPERPRSAFHRDDLNVWAL